MITITLSTALLCFAPGDCVPVLHGGTRTPTGIFEMQQFATDKPGYGGDVTVFHSEPKKGPRGTAYAIHRVWDLRPSERRSARLRTPSAADNGGTLGCINVFPWDYERVVAALQTDRTLLITR